jgi:hypothetical protein
LDVLMHDFIGILFLQIRICMNCAKQLELALFERMEAVFPCSSDSNHFCFK